MSPKAYILIIGTASKKCSRHAEFLRKQGYGVTYAPDNTQGFEIFQTTLTNLIILDQRRSTMTGTDILERITRKTRNIPVILLCNNPGFQELIKKMRLGAWDVLLPPLKEETLLMAIESALNRAVFISTHCQRPPNAPSPDQLQDLLKKNRKLIHAKKQLQTQLIRAQKMESMGILASGIAHDVNNIFGTIMCSSELLLDICPEESPYKTDIQRILKACIHGKNLVKQMLHHARRHPAQKIPLHLGEVITDMLPLIQANMPSQITLKTRFEADEYMINGIRDQIEQIVFNLVTNAIYALRSTLRPILEIRITNAPPPCSGQRQTPDIHRDCKKVTLTIKDNGQGIPQKNLSRIFTPLFTTKQNGEGTGLGLPIVTKIAQEHQASLSWQSRKDSGTSFHVRFPLIHDSKKIVYP